MDSFSLEWPFAATAWRGDAMKANRRARRVLIHLALILVVFALPAVAQSTVTVRYDGTKIWNASFQSAVMEVRKGTVLTVVGTRGDWVEVEVPGRQGDGRVTGFVFAPASKSGAASPAPTASTPSAPAPRPGHTGSGPIALRGFGQFGYTSFAARDSFSAVLGEPGGLMLGAGAEVRFAGGLFVSGAFERFNKLGERAFVFNGAVYQLGIPNTVTVMPIAVTAGWRLEASRLTPYGGGGIGRVGYREFSDFAADEENVDESFTSYHVLGGIEIRNGWVATAFEAQYTQVPDALGTGGVSAAFQEHNLGGFTMRVKVLVGR